MKLQSLVVLIICLLVVTGFVLMSCDKLTSTSAETVTKKSFPPPQVVVLADLPDSLQPKVTYLKDVPPPVTTTFQIPSPTKVFIDSLNGMPIPHEARGNGDFTNFTTADGLASDGIHTTFVDNKGGIWIGTLGSGACRYDGKQFITYTTENGLASNTVWEITQDSRGNIWFGTFGGITRYDGRDFITFTVKDGLPHNDVGEINEDHQGNIWFTTIGGGICKFNGKTFTIFTEEDGLTDKTAWSLFKDSHGNFWAGMRNGDVLYYDMSNQDNQRKFVNFSEQHNLKTPGVYVIAEDQEGNMWFGTLGNGLFRYDGKAITHFTSHNGLSCLYVNNLLVDRKGNLWIGACEGLYQFDGQRFTRYKSTIDLSGKNVSEITEDASGNLWFGTYGRGLFRYNGSAFTMYTKEPISDNVTDMLIGRDGGLWFATNGYGITWYSDDKLITFSSEHGLPTSIVNTLIQDYKGRFWFSTYYGGGVSCLESDAFLNPTGERSGGMPPLSNPKSNKPKRARLTNYSKEQGLGHISAYGILEDRKKNLWFGTYGGGASRFDEKSFTTFTTRQGLSSDEVLDIFEDSRGNLWFLYLNDVGMTLFNGLTFTHFTTAQGMTNNHVWNVTEDSEGKLWFGTEEGLNVMRNKTINSITSNSELESNESDLYFECYSTSDGLANNAINSVYADSSGFVVISTNKGVVFLERGLQSFESPGEITVYNTVNGGPLGPTGAIGSTGNIVWLSSGSDQIGLIRFDRNAIHRNSASPVVQIEQVKINNESIIWHHLLHDTSQAFEVGTVTPHFVTEELIAFQRLLKPNERDSLKSKYAEISFDSISKWNPVPINMTLPFRHNSLTFDFNAIVTTNHHLVNYQFMLEGFDASWNPVTKNSSATYGNIYEGTYTFKVKACSPEGIWSEPLSYSFRVLPPMHRTWWAYSIYALALITLVYFVHQYQRKKTIRMEQEKAKQKQAILNERLRISRDLHDEVGATLSGISLYSHIAKEQIKTENRDVVLNSLNVMQESAGEMVNKLNDIVWLLNPEKAHLHQLVEKLELYAEKMAEIKNIKVTTAIKESLSAIELPIDVRRNIYLIFKEAINNAVKYSQAASLAIDVRNDNHTLEFVLMDDGVGFAADQIRKGNGLDNMHHRANEIGAQLSLDSSPGKGTRLILTYKLTG